MLESGVSHRALWIQTLCSSTHCFEMQPTPLFCPMRRSWGRHKTHVAWKGCYPASAVVSRDPRSVSPIPSSGSPDNSQDPPTKAQSSANWISSMCIILYGVRADVRANTQPPSLHTIETFRPQKGRMSLAVRIMTSFRAD
jgi:hypothetical protein